MYDTSLSLHGLDPAHNAHQGAMVAAHLYDLEAAKKRGMTTVFVQGRKTEEGLPKEGKPGYVDVSFSLSRVGREG